MKYSRIALLLAGVCWAQELARIDPKLVFEVASFKPSAPDARGGQIKPSAGGERYLADGVPVRLMLQVAYRLKPEQITGGPSWIDTDRFDLNAKAEKPSTSDELHVMLMNLLAERCKLQFHKASKEMAVYAITVDKGGPKLTPHNATNSGDPWITQQTERLLHINLGATAVDMDYFAFRLAQLLDMPVVNQTGIKGGYDFKLEYTRDLPPGIPENAQLNGQPLDTSGPSLVEAMRQQLGLKLEKTRAPVDIIVIDHIEKPTGN
jgi:uncharacterized protein (TIGR03435 family)